MLDKQSAIILILLLGAALEVALRNYLFSWIFLFFLALILFKSYKVSRNFTCLRCGRCCRLLVKPSKEDIKRIKKAGYKNFLEKGKFMKRVNGYCYFLEIKKGIASCRVNKIKPELCKEWPVHKGIFGKQADMRCVRMFRDK